MPFGSFLCWQCLEQWGGLADAISLKNATEDQSKMAIFTLQHSLGYLKEYKLALLADKTFAVWGHDLSLLFCSEYVMFTGIMTRWGKRLCCSFSVRVAPCLVWVNDCKLWSLTGMKKAAVCKEKERNQDPSSADEMVGLKCCLMRDCQSNKWNNCSALIKVIQC